MGNKCSGNTWFGNIMEGNEDDYYSKTITRYCFPIEIATKSKNVFL